MRVSVCHCLDCQRRSGAPFAAQARFPEDAVTVTGTPRQWRRVGSSGSAAVHHFCVTCGTTLFYVLERQADLIAVAVGCFADPHFPAPGYSVYENRRHPWIAIAGEGIVHD
ncbi:glutathione-dependent formaldehyde-activating enzyme [Sphingomonas dokdonensis]|uniref:Glutathione-dependent formaldehyde-activating enzyme n=1 Tax=Sphingomonas dokdonensis TaxID=344880 RepID=A0A245ZNR0_9SPHN|nr:glutathione-dependent formaldehyde-activating enzyme [Sphingomonas dokdonensis]